MSKLYEWLLHFLAALAAIGIGFVAVAITYSVVLRQLFGTVPLWVNDVTSFLLVAITFAGGAYVLARDGHTRVDILLQAIHGRSRAVLDLVSALLGFAATAVLTAAAVYTVLDQYERATVVVRAIVSRTASTVNVSGPAATTVRQTPSTATESPLPSASAHGAAISSRRPPPREWTAPTTPIVSMMPVNMPGR